ncbi:phosphatase PAP2 family protein [Clostridium sp. MB40-C1]|uniref:phosphatase PAP2 family protein n=1 Tax=Clostridium sp. MB40-C1 TaxID=3070996 RepID=UPI0027E10333|nr:phosphatase PAP2 family protein [Clostridium sp. MB40-C1]WMJ81098.1 phosphatase PAP2 family protein [Clostridium sp. MB40-C1]
MLYKSTYVEHKKDPICYLFIIALLGIICSGFFAIKMRDSFQAQGGSIDIQVANAVNGIRTEAFNKLFIFISRSGDTFIAIIITLIIIGFFYYKRMIKEAAFYSINMLGTALVSQGLKMFIKRPRPKIEWLVDISKYTHVGKYSFPSGHTMIAMSGALVLIYFILSMVKNKVLSIITSILIFVYALLIGISRIYVGVHYLSDVLAGCALSAIWVFLILLIYRKLFS